jgi:transcriptional regulator with XRE-family HTH domain
LADVSSADIIALPPVDPTWARIGAKVRLLREERGITQDQLARDMRLDRRTLACAERGRVRLTSSQLYAATLALHVPMRALFEPMLDAADLRRISPTSGV